MYQVGQRGRKKNGRRRLIWLVIALLCLGFMAWVVIFLLSHLKSKMTIKQAPAITTKVTYDAKTKHYDEPDFEIDLPLDWQVAASPANGPYHLYRWQDKAGQLIEIYQDTIPVNFAVNRVLIVEGQVDHLQPSGTASDNCSVFTKSVTAAPNQVGVPAKWQDVSFLCDQYNKQRDVVGTSSTDGVNTVILKQPSTGASHQFFFTYTNHSTNPDYTPFYNALNSLRLR